LGLSRINATPEGGDLHITLYGHYSHNLMQNRKTEKKRGEREIRKMKEKTNR
jgi:hypothetical protein